MHLIKTLLLATAGLSTLLLSAEANEANATPLVLSKAPGQPSSWKLTDNKAAERWDFSYPVGNGQLGALCRGSFPQSMFHLSHDAVWKSGVRPTIASGSRKAEMDQSFAAAMNGDYRSADRHYSKAKNKGGRISTFQGLGDLSIEHLNLGEKPAIQRELDLYSGLATSSANQLKQSTFASYPDHCLAIQLENQEGLDCLIGFSRKAGLTKVQANGNEIHIDGQGGNHGTKFHCLIKAIGKGKITVEDKKLHLKGGDTLTLIIAVSTDHNRQEPRKPRSDGWQIEAREALDAATALGWEKLKSRAMADHSELMGRFDFDMGDTDQAIAAKTTPERLKLLQKGGQDPDLVESFVQLGRHMLIGSSRPGSLPPNLQGLWAQGMNAAWNGDYHLNVNVQMNLWPANVTGLDECNEPFFQMLKYLHRYGQSTAASLGCRGYAACLASDPWGYSEFHNGNLEYDSYALGGHWAQQHLMEYYRFSGDKEFLRTEAWPILQDGAKFILDWLHENPKTGKLITGPGGSPENIFRYLDKQGVEKKAFISIGNTHDLMIARESLSDLLLCASVLRIDNELTREAKQALPRIQETPINADGRIGEWWQPFKESWRGHRHKSHLYGLFPGNEITAEGTPELFAAANQSMQVRMDERFQKEDAAGGGATGWNLAWATSLWARLQEGDLAYATVLKQMRTQINENLFNRCNRPFQIDGNCGVVAGVVEMLVQSHESTIGSRPMPLIRLLPALPAAWKDGSARGLYCRNGLIIEEMSWKDGTLEKVVIYSKDGGPFRIQSGDKHFDMESKSGERVTLPSK